MSKSVQTTVVLLLVAAHVAFAVSSASTTSPTVDEPVHLAAGYTYLVSGDFRLNPEHPPLVKLLAGLPILMSSELEPDLESGAPQATRDSSSRSNEVLRREWSGLLSGGVYWPMVHELFYGVRDDVLSRHGASRAAELPVQERFEPDDFLHASHSMFVRARVMMLSFGVGLGILVWAWAREMFGPIPALLSLAAFAFDPNFIGHGALVTTDVAAAAATFGSVFFFWRALRSGRWVDELGCVLFVAVSATVKFSTVLLAPILAATGILWIAFPNRFGERMPGLRERLLQVVKLLVLGGLAAFIGIWACYGFRFDAVASPKEAARLEALHAPDGLTVPFREPGRLPVEWTLRRAAADRVLLARWPDGAPLEETERLARTIDLPAVDRALMAIHDWRALPEAYMMGLAHVRFSILRGAYLKGEYSNVGFPSYFAWAFLYKTSIPVLLLVAFALSGIVSGTKERRFQLLVLLLPVAIWGLVAMRSTLNIGHRHIFPIYPFLFVAIGVVASRWAAAGRRVAFRRVAVVASLLALPALVVLAPFPASWVPPHHLSYFNELAGGPPGGHRHLVDSNTDWGQDLPALARWVTDNAPNEILHLCYFGTADPRAYGIAFVNLRGGFEEAPVSDVDPRAVRGLIAVSVTNLRGVLWTPDQRAVWSDALAGATLVGRAGYSILIYRR